MIGKIKKFVNIQSPRTKRLTKNISYIAFLKTGNILANFLLVPLTINYVTTSIYGIWLTMYSIVSWMSIFDIGLSNGLRNNLTKSLSANNKLAAREYVSTTYLVLTLLSAFIFIFIIILIYLLDWAKILKLPLGFNENIHSILILLGAGFCLRFVVQNITTIYYAIQKPFLAECIQFLSNISILMIIMLFKDCFESKLHFLVVALSYPPILVMLIYTLITFLSKEYSAISPSFKYYKRDKVNSLLNLGVKFFFLQISSLIAYSMSNYLIIRYLTPNDVTNYNVAYKYFSVILILNNIVCLPLWSAFTEAYANRDMVWIKNTIKKMMHIFLLLAIIGFIMLLCSSKIYTLWTGVELGISTSLSIIIYLFMLVCSWNGIFVAFINGIGKIYLQMLVSAFPVIFMIPLSYFMVKVLNMGVSGIAFSMLFFNIISSLVISIQTYKILHNNAKGIWIK